MIQRSLIEDRSWRTGPVIFQDGDVYGKTVNLTSRIATYAGAAQVIASDGSLP
jgi:class 3 adenylate cyclase